MDAQVKIIFKSESDAKDFYETARRILAGESTAQVCEIAGMTLESAKKITFKKASNKKR